MIAHEEHEYNIRKQGLIIVEYKFLNASGSFKAWGVGFDYEYEANTGILDIINTRQSKPVLYIDTEQALAEDVLCYTRSIDKVAQLYALNFSNNISVDLTDILSSSRLKAILHQVVAIAGRANQLQKNDFKTFTNNINSALNTQKMAIKKARPSQMGESYFYGYFKNSLHKEAIKLQKNSLTGLLSELSTHISTTVISEQITSASDDDLNEALRLASELSMLSATINDDLKPIQHIKKTSIFHNKNSALQ